MSLTRSSNGIIGGVAGGIAKSTNLDPTWIRVAFVILAVFSGSGILIYALLWIIIPKEGSSRTIAEDGLDKAKRWAASNKKNDGPNY